MKKPFRIRPFLMLLLALSLVPIHALAWPTPDQWIPVYKGGVFLQDPTGDAQGSRNIVSDPAHDAAFMFNDGAFIHFRLRLDQDPTGRGGQGFLKSFGWGVEIDTNLNNGDYEWLLMVDGIDKTEVIILYQNSVQGTLGDPSDDSETECASITVAGNHQVTPADTSFNGDQDYFLDWRFPYDTFKTCTGLTDGSPLRLFFGSSSSTNNLTEQGADLVGGSDLYSGFSDFITPFGAFPATGTVTFVADAAGNGDVSVIDGGDTIFIRVVDGDQNWNPTSLQTLSVTLTTPGGDTETVTLTETVVNTGVFTGSISSFNTTPVVDDGTLQVWAPGETATVTYLDLVDADLNLNQVRTDTLQILVPLISISKSVNPVSTASGGTLAYSIIIGNTGTGDAFVTQIEDVLPTGFAYVPGTTSGFTTADPAITGQQLTWTGNWTVPKQNAGVEGTLILSFQSRAGGIPGTHFNNAAVSGGNFPITATGDTAPVTIGAPLMSLIKTVDKTEAFPGDELIYSVHYHNEGIGPAHTLIFVDTIPPNTTYVPGSLKRGEASSNYSSPTNTSLTDATGDDGGEMNGNNVVFFITTISPDDGVPDSGPDEGMLYFKVKID